VALAESDIELRFDGLGVRPRLDVQALGPGPFAPGDRVTFRSALNYPAFVTQGELRLYDLDAPGGARVLAVVPLAPNAEAAVVLPEGRTLAYAYSVRDARNRRDETRPVLLGSAQSRAPLDLAAQEQGVDSALRRDIAVRGGAVTVLVRNLPPGAQVEALGAVALPDPSGSAVIQRILPVGQHEVGVRVVRAGAAPVTVTRMVEVPRAEWFQLGVADLSFGRASGEDARLSGRLSGYAKGVTATGTRITLQADSGEDDLDRLFRNILTKDPGAILNRLDPDLAYPTYGDDASLVEDAPTSGGFYLKVERDGSFGLWGDFRAGLGGTELLRNERSLYGAQGVVESRARTATGEARLRIEGYAAQPDQLPQRDVLRGTGGSVYFLSRQDILEGSVTLAVERRDGVSGRVIARVPLQEGRDYRINHAQGVVTLASPLSGQGGGGALLSSSPNGDETLSLVAQYEWRPVSGTVKGMAFGGRAEAQLADGLRLGATVQADETGEADQMAYGLDLAWRRSERSFLEAEVARTEGPGFGQVASINGGVTGTSTASPGGSGTALRIEGQAALDELLAGGQEGSIGGYFQRYGAGFSSTARQVAEREVMWGVSAELPLSAVSEVALSFDHYDRAPSRREDKGQVLLRHTLDAVRSVELGYARLDRADPGGTARSGTRDDLAARLLIEPGDGFNWYLFAQGSARVTGDLDPSDRVGLGGAVKLGTGWSVEGELSGGATGPGARLLFGQEKGETDTVWFGYTLDPDRTIDDVVLTGRDRGRIVAGGRRQATEAVTVFGENTYDMFGRQRSLTTAYGIDYALSGRTVYSGSIETGIVSGAPQGEVERRSISLGVRHDDGAAWTARGRIELMRDDSAAGRVDTVLLSGQARYRLNDAARIVAEVEALHNEAGTDALPQGSYLDAAIGYALRPVLDDRLNLLARYRYLRDEVDQQLDGRATRAPLQRSHVFSIDAEYALSPRWTLGGKLGGRLSETAADAASAFARNDAWLAVVNARYHLVHEWDVLVEARRLGAVEGGTSATGAVLGVYRQIGPHVMLGASYNFGAFSDDLTDLVQDDRGAEINLIAKF
jgi:hypothetical protein